MKSQCQSEKRSQKTTFLWACLVFGMLAGCSSDGNILPKKERFTRSLVDAEAPDAPTDVPPEAASDVRVPRDPQANCIKPGTPRNEIGVGGYCEDGPTDCFYEAGPRFCTADFKEIAIVPDDAWFCTTTCTADTDCGSGAVCQMGGIGNGCVPLVCLRDASPTQGAGR